MSNKQVRGKKRDSKEQVAGEKISYDNHKPVWMFTRIDRDGIFAFKTDRTDFSAKDILDKILSYSTMTWGTIKHQTHDDGRSKNHYLNYNGLSNEARERIKKLHLEEYIDTIFSFSFSNMIRVVGIKENEKFYIVWYDPQHQIYPSRKKHT